MLPTASCKAAAPLPAQVLCRKVCTPNKRSSGTASFAGLYWASSWSLLTRHWP